MRISHSEILQPSFSFYKDTYEEFEKRDAVFVILRSFNFLRVEMKLYPASAQLQLEFDKVKDLLAAYCEGEYAREKAKNLLVHTEKTLVETELRQSHEFRQLLSNGIYFPNDHVLNLAKELKLLSIPGAVLNGEELLRIRKLAGVSESIFRWFDTERKTA